MAEHRDDPATGTPPVGRISAYPTARTLITERGVLPGPDGHTPGQLIDALKLQGWSCEVAPDGVTARKRHGAAGVERPALAVASPHALEGLTIVLARAIEFDDRHR